ncbi:MAG: diguanylate cyclase [Frankiales bacterium]|nr:diguanylate cyclase [Frankiales bacterium]
MRSSAALPQSGPAQARVLGGLLAVAGVFGLVFGTVPNPATPVNVTAVRSGVLLLAVGVALLAFRRSVRWWHIDVVLALTYVVAAYGVVVVEYVDYQLLLGLGVMAIALYAAYFLPPRRFLVHLVAMLALFSCGAALNPLSLTWLSYLAVVVCVAGVSLVVSRLVTSLHELVMRDELTGLLNRRGLDVVTAALRAEVDRSGGVITVGMIDLDGFKLFNDTRGHAAGDRLLCSLVDAWRPQLRASDVLARHGGDEFALVLPRTTRGEARELVARLRDEHIAPWSAGFAEWERDETLAEALGRADDELYAVKRGRDRGRAPQPASPPPDPSLLPE